jgi:fumarate hydratase class II
MTKTRTERDVLGEMEVPADAYWGISTQRALANFKISGQRMPEQFILALSTVKKACLLANMDLGMISSDLGKPIQKAVDEILRDGKMLDQFPIDVFQTGSGTQTNMNMNEVLANRANEILGKPLGKKAPVHPNDHVNMSQSSNDVIPTAMHVAALEALTNELMPALEKLIHGLDEKVKDFSEIVKVGRTHLQDAVPIPLSMEFDVYRMQMVNNMADLQAARDELVVVPIGGTALGTGLNAPEGFDEKVVEYLRWMGSGPRAGLNELILPQNEPGSSIMPGKINPTQSEALIQVCAQVIGHDAVVSFAESHGSILDLNMSKPVIIVNILDAITILSNGIQSFRRHCLSGLKINEGAIKKHLERSLMIVTRLTPIIGYDKAGEVARRAYETEQTVRETIEEMGVKIEGDLDDILDPKKMV